MFVLPIVEATSPCICSRSSGFREGLRTAVFGANSQMNCAQHKQIGEDRNVVVAGLIVAGSQVDRGDTC